jgi:hypothetical protein
VEWYANNPDWIKHAKNGSKEFYDKQYAERGGNK